MRNLTFLVITAIIAVLIGVSVIMFAVHYGVLDASRDTEQDRQALKDASLAANRIHKELRILEEAAERCASLAKKTVFDAQTIAPQEEISQKDWEKIVAAAPTDICMVLDENRRPGYEQFPPFSEEEASSLETLKAKLSGFLKSVDNTATASTGLIESNSGLILVTGQPMKSSVSPETAGYAILLARFLDPRELAAELQKEGVSFELLFRDSEDLQREEIALFGELPAGYSKLFTRIDRQRFAYVALNDWRGETVAVLRCPVRATVTVSGSSFNLLLLMLLLLTIATCFLLTGYLILYKRKKIQTPSGTWAWGALLLVFLLGLCLSVGIFLEMEKREADSLQAIFQQGAQRRSQAIFDSIKGRLRDLDAVRCFFEASEKIDRQEFRQFVMSLFIRSEQHGVGWVPLVTAEQRAEFEAALQQDGYPDSQITEQDSSGNFIRAAERPLYAPILFFEPLSANQHLLGFDELSEKSRKDAAEAARRSGRPIATIPVRLVGDQNNQMGFIVFSPVRGNSTTLARPAVAQAAPRGFILGSFRFRNLVESTLQSFSPTGYNLYLQDLGEKGESRVVYQHLSSLNAEGQSNSNRFSYTDDLTLGGRMWRITVEATPAFFAQNSHPEHWWALVAGFIFTVLFTLYLSTLLSLQQRAKALADTRSKELRRSEERWQFALEGTGDGVWDWDVQNGEAYFSPQWLSMFTLSEDDVNGIQTWIERVHPDERDRVRKALESLRQGYSAPSVGEHRVLTKRGEYRWILDRSQIVERSEEGYPKRIIGIHTDITELKRAEDGLRKNEAQMRALANNIPGVILRLFARADGTMGASYVSDRCKDLLQLDAGPATFYERLLTCLPENERPAFLTSMAKAVNTFSRWEYEGRFVKPSGEELYIRGMAEPSHDGAETVFNGVILDITQRRVAENALRESEIRFRRIFNSTYDAIFLHSADGAIYDVNDTMLEMFQVSREEALRFSIAEDYSTPEDPIDQLGPWWQEVVDGKEHFFPWQCRRPHDGSIFDGEVHLQRVLLPEGHAIMANVRDVTERKRLERQLTQAQRLESVGRLAGGVAHDFNNLLAIIMGYSELLLDELPESGGGREEAQEILRAGERAKELTSQLLAFSRKQVLQMCNANLNEIILGTEKMIRRLIGEDINVTLDLSPEIGTILADTAQIDQVIMNLCINARDAMPAGGKLLIATSRKTILSSDPLIGTDLAPGVYNILSVSDTGCGMDQETLRRVFDPFFTTKEKGRGTGLGLSMVFGIAKQHGGDITAYSEPGQGTTFRIYLPESTTDAENAPSAPSDVILPGQGETILVVEDEVTLRHLVCRILQQLGYKIFEARDVEDSLRLANELPRIDLLLTDVVMPGMNGREVFAKIEEIHPEAKVVYMSGYTDDIIAHHGVLEPGISFISKPFTSADISRIIHDTLFPPVPPEHD